MSIICLSESLIKSELDRDKCLERSFPQIFNSNIIIIIIINIIIITTITTNNNSAIDIFLLSEEPEEDIDPRCYRANGFFNHEKSDVCGK